MKRTHSTVGFFLFSVVMLAPCIAGASIAIDGIPIDPQFPEIGGSSPLSLPVLYQFHTSWDGIQWTSEGKDSARAALSYLNGFFVDQPAFQEEVSPDDFSIRWAGDDFFKNWGIREDTNHNKWDLNFKDALAVSAKPQMDDAPPWDKTKYPLGEIYFNTKYNWHYNPLTPPEEGKPDNPGDPSSYTDGEFDFWSVLLHETIHMLCVNKHADHPDEVMYAYFSDGERRWELKESDRALLRAAGYHIVPESTAILTWSLLAVCAAFFNWNRRRKIA